MIFIDKPLHEWLLKHPSLEVIKLACDSCGQDLITNKPFIEKGYAGIIAENCTCGRNSHTCISKVTTSPESYNFWINSIASFI